MARNPAAAEVDDAAPRHSGRLLLRMPSALHAELAELARREGTSLNQLITNVLSEAARRRRAGTGARERSSRSVRIALAANFVALAVTACLAIALLVVALRG